MKLTDDMDLGVGLNLYFQYALSIAIGFFFIFICSIPTLVFAYFGQAVSPQDQDIIGLYQLTIANIGYDPSSLTYLADSACSADASNIAPSANQTCISVMGNEYTTQSVSLVITGCELLAICIFFIMVAQIHRRYAKITSAHSDSGVPSITDYAVHVTNIPPDSSMEEIILHFSSLYQLDSVDFRGRLPVEDAAPVDSIGYSSNEIHVGTWVAECTMCIRMGKVVSYLDRRKQLMEQLYTARARMKMYGPKTPHVKGYNAKKYFQYEKVMLRVAAKVDKLNERIHLDQKPDQEDDDEEAGSSKKGKSSKGRPSSAGGNSATADATGEKNNIPDNKSDADNSGGGSQKSGISKSKSFMERVNDVVKDEPVLAAFVCFEYNESFARCIEDHAYYSYYPMRWCCPKQMLFKGRLLSVKRAPEPDQVVWENIEVGPIQKTLARLRTLLEIIVLLIVVYALFAAAADARNKYTNITPPTGFCAHALPQLFAGSDYTNEALLAEMKLTRAPNTERETQDALCDAVLPNSYYALFTVNGALDQPVGNYNISACSVAATGDLCPVSSLDPQCPCRTAERTQQCSSIGCELDATDPLVPCMSFSSADPLNCYCSNTLDSILNSGGTVAALSWFGSYMFESVSDITDECIDMKYYFGASKIAMYLAILVTFISNKILRNIVLRNVKSEHHISFDEVNRAIASKIFLCTYLNMSIIILLAFGTSTNGNPPVLTDNYIFSGPYSDFERGWYGTVGFYLVVNFIIITFPQFWNKYYDYLVWNRVTKFRAYKETT